MAWDVKCPECGGEVAGVEYAYGSPDRYDGISEWECMDKGCGARVGRWTGNRLADGETELRFGGPECLGSETWEHARGAPIPNKAG